MSYFDYVGKKGEKKALWQQLCPLSMHFSTHVCTPDTHCHVIWPAKARRDKPTLVPLHFAMRDCLDGRQKSPFIVVFFFLVPVERAGKGRGETKQCATPQVSFSPVVGTAVRGFPVDELHSFPAALELHARGGNVAALCCSKMTGSIGQPQGPGEISAFS